ncbi:hypothetical protein EJB05_16980, partial [Eragrostis curvula]
MGWRRSTLRRRRLRFTTQSSSSPGRHPQPGRFSLHNDTVCLPVMGDNGWRFLLATDDDGGCSPPPTCRKCSSLQWDFPHFPSFTLSPLCLMDFHVDSKEDKMRSQNIEVLCHMKAGKGPVSPFAAFGINMVIHETNG